MLFLKKTKNPTRRERAEDARTGVIVGSAIFSMPILAMFAVTQTNSNDGEALGFSWGLVVATIIALVGLAIVGFSLYRSFLLEAGVNVGKPHSKTTSESNAPPPPKGKKKLSKKARKARQGV